MSQIDSGGLSNFGAPVQKILGYPVTDVSYDFYKMSFNFYDVTMFTQLWYDLFAKLANGYSSDAPRLRPRCSGLHNVNIQQNITLHCCFA